jgi:hypothetical protein
MRTIASLGLTLIAAGGLLAVSQTAKAEGPITTSGGPRVNFQGCYYYQHAEWQGMRQAITDGTRQPYVGDEWNDQISSIACNVNCSLTVYQHRDYGGLHRTFYPNIQYVGDAWNDQISSMVVNCGKED